MVQLVPLFGQLLCSVTFKFLQKKKDGERREEMERKRNRSSVSVSEREGSENE